MKKITPKQSGIRLDAWLAKTYPEKSRSSWQKRIKAGEILINGEISNAHHSLKETDYIQIKNATQKPSTLKAENMDLDIIFEDKNYVVINKPAGLVVHPGAGHSSHTLVHGLLHHFKGNLSNLGDPNRPGIIHRLDKDTSGLIVIAKTETAHRFIAEQFEKKQIQKKYLALVDGHISPKTGTIEAPLNRNKNHRKKIAITAHPSGRYALTHYEVQQKFKEPINCSLIEVRIETGRTHQIRVHFQSIGYPVVGDITYGRRHTNQTLKMFGLERQFLHAAELSFISPTTKKEVHYKSELPKDLNKVLTQLC
ncbi:MAG: RluA family pseudouridine synthase [Candidatus Peregrinibacteria bacterium]|nr:RluA family pseudouridine synthase [Candidatus Peregrinibacteria bacterium]